MSKSNLEERPNPLDARRTTHPHYSRHAAGLACGGKVSALLEPLNEAMLPIFETVANFQESSEDCVLATIISADGSTKKILLNLRGETVEGGGLDEDMLVKVRDAIRTVGMEESAAQLLAGAEKLVVELIQAAPPLIIFGGGHVGKVTSRIAALAGFRVTVVDDRPEYANAARFPEANAVVCEPFDVAFKRLEITPATYVVIVTRGHKHDELVLEKTLQFEPKYVGMIGSKRKVLLTFKNLEGKSVPRERLARVHAPIGLDIGAKTADEIGVSIVAEMVAVRRKSVCATGALRITIPTK